jgi:hypothetical protein
MVLPVGVEDELGVRVLIQVFCGCGVACQSRESRETRERDGP